MSFEKLITALPRIYRWVLTLEIKNFWNWPRSRDIIPKEILLYSQCISNYRSDNSLNYLANSKLRAMQMSFGPTDRNHGDHTGTSELNYTDSSRHLAPAASADDLCGILWVCRVTSDASKHHTSLNFLNSPAAAAAAAVYSGLACVACASGT